MVLGALRAAFMRRAYAGRTAGIRGGGPHVGCATGATGPFRSMRERRCAMGMDRIVGFYRAIIGMIMVGVIVIGVLLALAALADNSGGGLANAMLAVALIVSAVMGLGLAATAVAIHDRQIEMARTLERIAVLLQSRG
jgi:hypothetical protein